MTDSLTPEELYAKLTSFEAGEVISTEGIGNFFDFIRGIKDRFAAVLQINQPALVYQPGTRIKDLFKKRPYSSYAEMKVLKPEGAKPSMPIYIDTVDDIIEELEDIQKRVLFPLRDWAAGTLSTPGFADKAWLDKKVKTINLEKLKKEFAKVYDANLADIEMEVPLYKAYPTEKDFIEADEDIKDLVEMVNEIHEANLNGTIREILSYVTQLEETERDRTSFEKTPAATIARVVELMRAGAEEVEFLAMMMFQADVIAKSYTTIVSKLKEAK